MSTDDDSRGKTYLSSFLDRLDKLQKPIDDERFLTLSQEYTQNKQQLDKFIEIVYDWSLKEEYKELSGFSSCERIITASGLDAVLESLIKNGVKLNPVLTNKSKDGVGKIRHPKSPLSRLTNSICHQKTNEIIFSILLRIVGYETVTNLQMRNTIDILSRANINIGEEIFLNPETLYQIKNKYSWTKEVEIS